MIYFFLTRSMSLIFISSFSLVIIFISTLFSLKNPVGAKSELYFADFASFAVIYLPGSKTYSIEVLQSISLKNPLKHQHGRGITFPSDSMPSFSLASFICSSSTTDACFGSSSTMNFAPKSSSAFCVSRDTTA